MPDLVDRRLVAAPMMGRTDAVGCAYLRQVLPNALLFTEMIHSGAIVYNGALARARLQEYFDWQEFLPPREQEANEETNSATNNAKNKGGLVLQLGGSDPSLLARASVIARTYPFCEINLNLGCPSPRVTKGGFGACMMKDPPLAAACVAAMKQAAGGLPVSVKTRIGVDEGYDEASLHAFVDALCTAGCDVLYLHARKAWLKGVSAKDNRTLPPLQPQVAQRVQEAQPTLPVVYNGGIQSADEAQTMSASFAGVMVGRALWRAPCLFAGKTDAERPPWRKHIADKLLEAIEKALLSSRSSSRSSSRASSRASSDLSPRVSRRLVSRSAARLSMRAMSLYHGEPDAGDWRRRLLRAFDSLKAVQENRRQNKT